MESLPSTLVSLYLGLRHAEKHPALGLAYACGLQLPNVLFSWNASTPEIPLHAIDRLLNVSRRCGRYLPAECFRQTTFLALQSRSFPAISTQISASLNG
jgi:hypothetical protein